MKKTKIVTTVKTPNFTINGEDVEVVDCFRLLRPVTNNIQQSRNMISGVTTQGLMAEGGLPQQNPLKSLLGPSYRY